MMLVHSSQCERRTSLTNWLVIPERAKIEASLHSFLTHSDAIADATFIERSRPHLVLRESLFDIDINSVKKERVSDLKLGSKH